MKKKSSENDQLTGHFQSFFLFFHPLEPKSEKKSCKSTNKKIWPNTAIIFLPMNLNICFGCSKELQNNHEKD